MLTYFCPGCWKKIPEHEKKCPACGYDLREFEQLSYEQKLLLSLRHPIRENQLIAVRILGQLGTPDALPEFQRLLEAETDYYLLREVLIGLMNIHHPRSRELLQSAMQHRSRLVSRFAQEVLRRKGLRDTESR